MALIDKVAGIKQQFVVDDVKERVAGRLDQLLMKWISKEGKDMFNLQANAYDISNGIKEDLDMDISKIGISITDFAVSSFSYPEEVQAMQKKAASQSMVGDMNKYGQMAMYDGMAQGGNSAAGSMANTMAGMQMGMMMGQQMVNQMSGAMNGMNGMPQQQMQQAGQSAPVGNGVVPKFCPECVTPTNGARFCANCVTKLI